MKPTRRRAVTVLALLAAILPIPSAVPAARTCGWEVVRTPAGAGSVRGADVGPEGQILAVGDRLTERGVVGRSMRWDGSSWSRAPVAPAAGAGVYLADITFVGDEEAVAVGTRVVDTEHPYSLWWDGAVWTELPMPAIAGSGWLTSVTRVPGTSRAWAVGWRDGPSAAFNPQPLIMRWQEGRWRVSLSRLHLRDEALLGVTSIGTETWAVGATRFGSSAERTLTLRHRQGDGWRVVPSPRPGRFQELVAVSARSATDVVAVGRRSAGGTRGLMIRWDGERWRMLDADRVPALARVGSLGDVAHGPGTVWVVGERIRAIGPDADYAWHPPVVLRRRAGNWRSVPVPRVRRALLEAAVVVGPGDVWALGAVQYDDGSTPLAYHRCA
jgi:hypothetical protein